MTQTITDAERLNRLQRVTAAAGIRGNEPRLELATDWAMTAPWMTTAQIIAATMVAIPDSDQAASPQATAPAPIATKRNTLPDAQAVYAARNGGAK